MSLEQTYSKLKLQQLRAIALILEGKKITEIAKIVGVRIATVSSWRNHNPTFKQALGIQLKQRSIEYRVGFPDPKCK